MTTIKLDASVWQAMKYQLFLIQRADNELKQRQQELGELLQQTTGIDVSSGQWNLDIDHGLLEGEPAPDEITDEGTTQDVIEQDDLSSRRNAKTRSKGGRGNSIHPTDPSVS